MALFSLMGKLAQEKRIQWSVNLITKQKVELSLEQ